jgi:hypothetical protein
MAAAAAPLQYVALAIELTVGVGFTVTVKVVAGPVQPFAVAVTLTVAVTGVLVALVAV